MIHQVKKEDYHRFIRRELRKAKKNGNTFKYIAVGLKNGDYKVLTYMEGINIRLSVNAVNELLHDNTG